MNKSRPSTGELFQIFSVASYQFGEGLANLLKENAGRIFVTRYSTGRIRVVYIDEEEALYFNPRTGLFSLSYSFASKALSAVEGKRIFAKREIFVNFSSKSLLAPAVLGSSDDVRAGDEVFIVDESGRLLAVGKSLLSSCEIGKIKRGEVAVIKRKEDFALEE